MESIETSALLELSFMLESSIDVQFQAWMALSFAVIVASYSAKEDLATGVRIAITAIYFMAAYALLARWITEGVRLDEIHEILASRGVVFQPVWYAPQTRMATYILGSLLTIGAVFYFGNKTENNVDVDT